MTCVLLLHAYSSRNRGDGLLVDESLELLRVALGHDVQVELAASDPASFAHLGVPVYSTKPGWTGWDRDYRRILRRFDDFDVVVAVGGGYLRAGHLSELLKCLLVMGPQLRAAARTSRPTVYLPQSVGPFRLGTRTLFRRWMQRIDTFFLRDDRSVTEAKLPAGQRTSDLAILSPTFTRALPPRSELSVDPTVVLTTRRVRGRLTSRVNDLAALLRQRRVPVVGYVQSAVGGNDDTAVQWQLTGEDIITDEEFLREGTHASGPPRVVVAVRMHAALMAIRAGHFVIHLAYERKGFAAFADLGLSQWVHNVNSFDPAQVADQVEQLRSDEQARALYRELIHAARPRLETRYAGVVAALRRCLT